MSSSTPASDRHLSNAVVQNTLVAGKRLVTPEVSAGTVVTDVLDVITGVRFSAGAVAGYALVAADDDGNLAYAPMSGGSDVACTENSLIKCGTTGLTNSNVTDDGKTVTVSNVDSIVLSASDTVTFGESTTNTHLLSERTAVPTSMGDAKETGSGVVIGTDVAGAIVYTGGTPGSNVSIGVTYTRPYAAGTLPIVIVTPGPGADFTVPIYISESTTTGFRIAFKSAAAYTYYYHVIGVPSP